jgi:serine/threonine-protein kinase
MIKGNWQKGDSLCQNQYEIQKKLGEGGFGVTYLAKNRQNKPVVIKTLHEAVQINDHYAKLRQDFLNEAIRLAKCSHHKYIVKILELIEIDGLPCMVMEYIEGNPLDTLIKSQSLTQQQAITYIKQIGEALTFIHQQGLLHRDIKPSNIIIREATNEAILIDFGISREFDYHATMNHTAFSSEGFTPLEQYYPSLRQAPHTDVHALAATLYFLLTHKYPRDAQHRYYSLIESGKDSLIEPQTLNPQISDELNQAILTGMALHPEMRPNTIRNWLVLLPFCEPLKITTPGSFITLPTKEIPASFPTQPAFLEEKTEINQSVNSQAKATKEVTNPRKWLGKSSLLGLSLIIFLLLFLSLNFVKTKISQTESPVASTLASSDKIYQNKLYQFSLTYPHQWTITDYQTPQSFSYIIAQLSPKINNDLSTQLIVEIRENNLDLETAKQQAITEIKQWINDVEIREISNIYINQNPAYKIVYRGRNNGQIMQRIRIGMINNGQEYALVYQAKSENYALFKQEAQNIINSFQLGE